jgi:hypothetical protein
LIYKKTSTGDSSSLKKINLKPTALSDHDVVTKENLMTKFKKITLIFSIMVTSSMLMSTAQAAPPSAEWKEITNPSTSGFAVGANSVQYGLVAAQTVWVYDGDNPSNTAGPGNSQSGATIGNLIKTQFGLTNAISLTSDGDFKKGKESGSFTVASSFDYLAIHYGRGELLFHWDTPFTTTTAFSFTNLPRGISNYRAYLSAGLDTPPVSAVPEPETYGMMIAGLGLLGFMARRRKSV